MSSHRLGDRRWTDLPAAPLVLIPVGSTEQHGPHLPLDTDTRVAHAVAESVARDGGWLLGPAVPVGASGEHEGFPGTISIGTVALTMVLVELGRSLGRWAGQVVLVNGHGGNLEALRAAVPTLRYEGRDVAWWPCLPSPAATARLPVPPDAHAGRLETSLMCHLRPASVDLARAEAGDRTPLPELLPRLQRESMAAISPNGVLGDPSGASAAEGAMLLADMVAELGAAIPRWQIDGGGRLGQA